MQSKLRLESFLVQVLVIRGEKVLSPCTKNVSACLHSELRRVSAIVDRLGALVSGACVLCCCEELLCRPRIAELSHCNSSIGECVLSCVLQSLLIVRVMFFEEAMYRKPSVFAGFGLCVLLCWTDHILLLRLVPCRFCYHHDCHCHYVLQLCCPLVLLFSYLRPARLDLLFAVLT